jgi:uncharacterized protein YjbI with pentapeptide repeats
MNSCRCPKKYLEIAEASPAPWRQNSDFENADFSSAIVDRVSFEGSKMRVRDAARSTASPLLVGR